MTIDTLHETRLCALLDTLLPGKHGFPPASKTTVAAQLLQACDDAGPVRDALAALDAGFCDLDPAGKVAVVTELEQQLAERFQALVAAVYSAYYTDPTVLAFISRQTGYRHPPQPEGYVMPVFDETILSTVRQAAPSWRDTRVLNSAHSFNPEGKAP